jgi:N-acetylmuramoyl-L-alanine amidase
MRVAAVLLLGFALESAARAETILERVELLRDPVLAVRIRVTAPVRTAPQTLPPDGDRPFRLFVDLPDTRLDAGAAEPLPGIMPLLGVRTGQFDATTARVVLDLARPLPFQVRHEPEAIIIKLGAPLRAEAAPLVVVDAGHGGHDPGATGLDGVLEKAITLDIARRVAARLGRTDALAVRLTRTGDSYVSIDERIAYASDAALFVSLHANAAADASLRGVEVFYGGGAGMTAASGGARSPMRLGLDMLAAVEERLDGVRAVARPGTFGVLARNAVPSVLVEIGYLTNPSDVVRLRDDAYRDLIAEAIADGAARFLAAPVTVASR